MLADRKEHSFGYQTFLSHGLLLHTWILVVADNSLGAVQ